MEGGVIISVGPIASALKEWLVHLDFSAAVLDCTDIVAHEVDCQLYGSLFRSHCNDPLLDIYSAMSVPTDYREYISRELYQSVERLLAMAVGTPKQGWSYVVEWVSPATGVIKSWPDQPRTPNYQHAAAGGYAWHQA